MTDRELLEENNKMLKEILSFVRKVDSVEYRDHHDFMEFLRNVAADIWVEYTEPEQKRNRVPQNRSSIICIKRYRHWF